MGGTTRATGIMMTRYPVIRIPASRRARSWTRGAALLVVFGAILFTEALADEDLDADSLSPNSVHQVVSSISSMVAVVKSLQRERAACLAKQGGQGQEDTRLQELVADYQASLRKAGLKLGQQE